MDFSKISQVSKEELNKKIEEFLSSDPQKFSGLVKNAETLKDKLANTEDSEFKKMLDKIKDIDQKTIDKMKAFMTKS